MAFEPMADDDEVGVIQQDAPTPICSHEEQEQDANMWRDAPTLVAQEKIDNSTERAWGSLARLRWCSSSWLLERILFTGLSNCRRSGAVYEAEEKSGRRQTSSCWQYWRNHADRARVSRLAQVQLHEKTQKKAQWVSELVALFEGTDTSMGRQLNAKPESATLLGGRRASTLRDRVRAAKQFVLFSISRSTPYPKERSHLTDFLAARQSDPCTRNILKGACHGQGFLEEIASVKLEDRSSSAPIHTVVYKELLPTALQRKRSRVMLLACTLPCWRHWRKSSTTPMVFITSGFTLGGFWSRLGAH